MYAIVSTTTAAAAAHSAALILVALRLGKHWANKLNVREGVRTAHIPTRMYTNACVWTTYVGTYMEQSFTLDLSLCICWADYINPLYYCKQLYLL